MDIEKELHEREVEVGVSRKLTTPTMIGSSMGSQDVPGPKGPVGPKRHVPVVPQPVETPKDGSPRIAQLDPRTVLQVELLATKKKLAEADERMGLWAVQDARRRKQELDREEASVLAEVSRQLGATAGSSIRLVDKERGLCQVE